MSAKTPIKNKIWIGKWVIALIIIAGIIAFFLASNKLTQNQSSRVGSSTNLVNGKTLDTRISEAYTKLHVDNSEQQIRSDFPDIELVYTDYAQGLAGFPKNILPFEYYYSPEADLTFNICAIHKTVFICEGKVDELVTPEDLASGRCVSSPEYQKKQD